MEYKIIRFEKERTFVNGRSVPIYVAVIQMKGQEQPFRVTIENFDSQQAALAEVARWIEVQTNDREQAVREKKILEKEMQSDKVLEELNS